MSVDASIYQGGTLANPAGAFLQGMQLSQHQRMQREQLQMQQESRHALADERDALAEDRRARTAQRHTVDEQNAAIDQLMSTSMRADPETGVFTFDRGTFEQGLIQSNLGHLYPTIAEHLDKLDASSSKIAKDRRTQIAQSILAIRDAGNTPEAVQTAAAYLLKNGAITKEHLQPILSGIENDPSPENIGAMMQRLGAGLPEYRELTNADEKRRAELEGTRADTRKKGDEERLRQLAYEGQLLGATTNEADYQTALSQLDPARQRLHVPHFSQAYVSSVRRRGLTAQQQVQADEDTQKNATEALRARTDAAREGRLEKTTPALTDPTYDRDFREYQAYTRDHAAAQRSRVEFDPNTGQNKPSPYEPALSFDAWRAQQKGRPPLSAPGAGAPASPSSSSRPPIAPMPSHGRHVAPSAPGAPGSRGAAPRPPVSPVSMGQVVTLRSGARLRVTKIFPDGTFDGDPVR